MSRGISAKFRAMLEASNSSDVIIYFVTITHPALLVPVRVNSDLADYVLGGQTFYGFGFKIILPTDDEQTPRASVSIQNVTQDIGIAVQSMSTSPQIQIQIFLKSDFTDDLPRQPIGTPSPEYSAPLLRLRNVSCDAMTLSGDLYGYDLTTEPWPSIRSTQDRLPGLYR